MSLFQTVVIRLLYEYVQLGPVVMTLTLKVNSYGTTRTQRSASTTGPQIIPPNYILTFRIVSTYIEMGNGMTDTVLILTIHL